MPVPDPVPSPLHVVVVGGGLGGVTAAVVLGKAGLKVDIFEQAPAFAEIGAGINLGPNTIQTLRKLGLGEEYDSVAETDERGGLFFEWWDGREDKKYGETYTNYPRSACHRARLLDALLSAMPPNVNVHFGCRVTSVENVGNKARLTYTSRGKAASSGGDDNDVTTTDNSMDADVIVGADGVKSVIRTALELPSPPHAYPSLKQGDDAAAAPLLPPASYRYTGTYCYRGLIPMDLAKSIDVGTDEENTAAKPRMWFGPGKHILIFPIDQGTICNVVAFVSDRSLPKDQRKFDGPWIKPVPLDKMLQDFADWDEHPRKLLKLFPEAERAQWALHEVLSPTTWRRGRITLLGDSAHASLPHNGAGAGQAIEDAYVLRSLLTHPACDADNVEQFLQAYEDVRIPRTSAQQLDAIETGEMFEFARPGFDSVDKIAREMLTRHDWIWDFPIEKNVEEAMALLKKRGVVGV